MTLAWDSDYRFETEQTTAVTSTWSFDRAYLLSLACPQVSAGVPAYATVVGVTSVPLCE